MTATEPTTPQCPACWSENTMIGASGNGLCFDCQHSWDPATVTAGPKPTIEPFGMAPVEEVYGAENAGSGNGPLTASDDFADELATFTNERLAAGDAILEELIGGTARLEGGQIGTVVSFPSIDSVEVLLNDGRTEIVDFSDVERITPRAPAPETVDVPAEGNEEAAAVKLTGELAVLIVKAAVASMPDAARPGEPVPVPIGFLPDDPNLQPIVEQAAVQAVRGVIAVFDLDAAGLLAAIGIDPDVPNQGDPTTEVASDASASNPE